MYLFDELFLLALYGVLFLLFRWAFKRLPGESWQVLGCVPTRRNPDGSWQGWNLTWYGLFNALSIAFAVCVFLILSAAVNVYPITGMILVLGVLAICLPAASIVARWVEGKSSTLSVGGASFVGIVTAPWLIWAANAGLGALSYPPFPVLPMLAAVSVAYAFGEGIGRLACISFGCCYGKPLSDCPPWLGRLFAYHHFVFIGKTKKIAYAHQLDGQAMLPIQALTAGLYAATGLAGFYVYLQGYFGAALVISLTVTQLWRILSETLRADYRGEGKISAYQVMAGLSVFYTWLVAAILPSSGVMPSLPVGLLALWNPAVLICLSVIFMVVLMYTGKSSVTDSLIRIDVVKDRI